MKTEKKIELQNKVLAISNIKKLLKTPLKFDGNFLKSWGNDLIKNYEYLKK